MAKLIYLLILGMLLTCLPSVVADLSPENYFECLAGKETACSDKEYTQAIQIALIAGLVGFGIYLKKNKFI